MRIAILHLTDIHISSSADPVFAKIEKIVGAVRSLATGVSKVLIAMSGDSANTGDGSEFDAALRFFGALKASLAEIRGLEVAGVVAVPGNHDCNFRNVSDMRGFVLDNLLSLFQGTLDLQGDKVKTLLSVQNTFFEFESKLSGCDEIPTAQRLHYKRTFTFDNARIEFECFNTAWLSRRNEQQSELFIPKEATQGRTIIGEDTPTLIFSIFHHPFNWLDASNARLVTGYVEKTSDFVLTGHEHVHSSVRKQYFSGGQVDYVEGAALQELSDPQQSGFNVILLDLENEQQQVHHFVWSSSAYFDKSPTEWFPLARNRDRLSGFFINDTFFSCLTDAGTGYTHPRKRVLTLDDIFVYPSLRRLSIDDIVTKTPGRTWVKGSEILDNVKTYRRVLITGSDDSGKTALAKRMYLDLRKQFVPVLAEGKELRGLRTKDDFVALIRKLVEKQYDRRSVDEFMAQPSAKRLLILDDFHHCGMNLKGQNVVTSAAEDLFDNIIVFASDVFRMTQIAASSQEPSSIGSYEQFEIKEFGHTLRSELIRKWHLVGREYTVDEADLSHEITTTEKLISTLLGKNVLPSYPVTILTLLQSWEAQQSPNTTNGSYGYLYEALIKTALLSVSERSTDLDTKITYISRLAYAMFLKDSHFLTAKELSQLHVAYCDEFSMNLDPSRMVSELTAAHVLNESGGAYVFRYRYYYYYFVAKYFQDNKSSNPKIREHLAEMADRLYFEEFANTLIFYVYLTKDREVIEQILKNATAIYEERKPCDFEADVEFLNKLYKEAPKPLPSLEEIEAGRESYRDRLDEAEEQAEALAPKYDEKIKYDKQLNDVLKINIAFKTLQILGQILRNFPGSLVGELKFQITRECYQMGLRTLAAILAIAEDNLEELRQYFASLLVEKQALLGQDLATRTDEALIQLTIGSAFGTLKRISYAVGHEQLAETYNEVLGNGESLAVRLIDIGIKLDHFSRKPEAEIKRILKDIQKNLFAYSVLRDQVNEFLYVYRVDHPVKQALGSLFKIKTSSPKYLANPSKKN